VVVDEGLIHKSISQVSNRDESAWLVIDSEIEGSVAKGSCAVLEVAVNRGGRVMEKVERDEQREQRIHNEVVVDAYGKEEIAMGWYYYLEDCCTFPFTAVCRYERAISPLLLKDEVEVIGLAPENECGHEMFVEILWRPRPLAVPLMQLRPITASEKTLEAFEDWQYWVSRGYEF